MSDRMPSLTVGALTVHPTNPRIILTGTGEYADCPPAGLLYNCAPLLSGVGIYRSFNGGFNWTLVPTPDEMGRNLFTGTAVTAIRFNPTNNHIFAATVAMAPPGLPAPQRGVAISVSLDLGFTWNYPPPGLGSLTGLAVTDLVTDNAGNLYATVSRTRDATGNLSCNPPGVGTGAADSACGVWYSSDEAQTWTQVSAGLPPPPPPPPVPAGVAGQIYKLALAVSTAANPRGSQVLYTVIGDMANQQPLGVYRTADGATTPWVQIGDNTRPPRGVNDIDAGGRSQETQADYDPAQGGSKCLLVQPRGGRYEVSL